MINVCLQCWVITGIIATTARFASALYAEACMNQPGNTAARLMCSTGGEKVYLMKVSVGQSWVHCDDYYCKYEDISPSHQYFLSLIELCNGESLCEISAGDLKNISSATTPIFDSCVLQNTAADPRHRNKVKVEYICSADAVTATEPIPTTAITSESSQTSQTGTGSGSTAVDSSSSSISVPNPSPSSAPLTTDSSGASHADQTEERNFTMLIAVPIAAVGVMTILVVVLLVILYRRRMCLWKEKTASLAGIKPSARTDNNNMERKQSPPSYDTVEEPYHVLDESATYYNSDDVTLTTQTKRSDVHLLQDNLYSLPSSQSEATSPLQTQLTADQQTEQPGLSNKSYTDHCITGKANVPGGNNSEYSIAEEVMPSKRKKTKLPPVYTEVNKNRNPIKKNQVGSGDRGYVNHPLNGTGGSSFEGDQPEMIDNDIYEGTSDDDSLPGGAAYGNTSSHHKEVTEYTENDLYGTD